MKQETIAELHRQGELALQRRAARPALDVRSLMALAETQRCQGRFAAASESYARVAAARSGDWRKAAWLHAMLRQERLPFTPTRGVWPVPFARIENFLPPKEHERAQAIALSLAPRLGAAKIGTGAERRVDESQRLGLSTDPLDDDALNAILIVRIRALMPTIQERLRLQPWVPPHAIVELQAYPDGGYGRVHRDNHQSMADPRMRLNCIYYVHREPRAFRGGDLLLYDTSIEAGDNHDQFAFSRIEPTGNSLVVMPRGSSHGVGQVEARSSALADARLAVAVSLRDGRH